MMKALALPVERPHQDLESRPATWLQHLPSWAPVAALAFLALALRLFRLDHESLVHDETYTLMIARQSVARVIALTGAHEQMPLYFLLVHVALGVRDSWLTPRVVATVFGVAGIPLLYLLGRRLFGQVAGLVAALLLAISPFQTWYSQIGRGYELAGFLVMASYFFLVRVGDEDNFKWWAGYTLTTALALYTEYITAFALLPHFYWFVRRVGTRRRLPIAWGLVVLAYLPWIGFLVQNAVGVVQQYWIPRPTLTTFTNTVLLFLGWGTPCANAPCAGPRFPLPVVSGHEAVVAVAAAVVAALLLAYSLLREHDEEALLLLWLCAPFALVLLLALRRSLYVDRVFVDATYPLFLLAGAGVARWWSGSWRYVGVALLSLLMAAGSLLNLDEVYARQSSPPWRQFVRDFTQRYHAGDRILYYPALLKAQTRVYLPPKFKLGPEYEIWTVDYLDLANLEGLRGIREAQFRERQLKQALRGATFFWLVSDTYAHLPKVRDAIYHMGYRLVWKWLYQPSANQPRLEYWGKEALAARLCRLAKKEYAVDGPRSPEPSPNVVNATACPGPR